MPVTCVSSKAVPFDVDDSHADISAVQREGLLQCHCQAVTPYYVATRRDIS